MSQTITQPDNTRITLNKTEDYRDSYANSVQVRLSVWDFFLIFGTLSQQSPDEVTIDNFQGIYLSPQQAKALLNVLQHNVAHYEQAYGVIAMGGQQQQQPQPPRYVAGSGPVH
jgi:flagellar protein FlaG